MNAAEIMLDIAHAGGNLSAEGGNLILSAPAPLSGDLLSKVKAHKLELLASLVDSEIQEHLEERAAIQEFDSGLSRKEAEERASKNIRVYDYKLGPDGPWLVLIAPGEDLEQARATLLNKFGGRLADIRQHQSKPNRNENEQE